VWGVDYVACHLYGMGRSVVWELVLWRPEGVLGRERELQGWWYLTGIPNWEPDKTMAARVTE